MHSVHNKASLVFHNIYKLVYIRSLIVKRKHRALSAIIYCDGKEKWRAELYTYSVKHQSIAANTITMKVGRSAHVCLFSLVPRL